MKGATVIQIDAPLCAHRPYLGRDYQETWPLPSPATLFGLMLSMCGLESSTREKFAGSRMAVAVRPGSARSTLLQMMHRGEKKDKTTPKFRPEYREVLSEQRIWCALLDSEHDVGESLAQHVREALMRPERIERYGGLSLGESTFLIDDVRLVDVAESDHMTLQPNPDGDLHMPIWIDFVDAPRTTKGRFTLVRRSWTNSDLFTLTAF